MRASDAGGRPVSFTDVILSAAKDPSSTARPGQRLREGEM
ncbi:MAG: hypothetical protein JWO31_3211 [Phycisphaerales bacterium]|nr:hypothetical protein [Phycisphaerales bacterium]